MKTALGRGFRAMHDFHLAQVFKTHGTSTAIIDYVAVHGFCLTRVHALQAGEVLREVEVGHASHSPLTVAAFTWDNCDFSADHEYYGGRHIGHLRGCGISRRPYVAHARPSSEGGPAGRRYHDGTRLVQDGEQWQGFLSVFDDAVFRFAVARIASEGGSIDTCLKIELRQASGVVTSVGIVSLYLCANVSVPLPPQSSMRISG